MNSKHLKLLIALIALLVLANIGIQFWQPHPLPPPPNRQKSPRPNHPPRTQTIRPNPV